MKSVYAVTYQERVQEGKQKPLDGAEETKNIMAANAEDAIEKARKRAIGQKHKWQDEEDGKDHTETVVAIDVQSVRHVASIDF